LIECIFKQRGLSRDELLEAIKTYHLDAAKAVVNDEITIKPGRNADWYVVKGTDQIGSISITQETGMFEAYSFCGTTEDFATFAEVKAWFENRWRN
jgi:hypothetical protein